MSALPSCSILIPCYNGAKFLPRLFDTIEGQTVPFAEVVLFDDQSTDQSAQIAADYGVRVLHSTADKNLGPSYARNQLLRATDTEWIHFHDADDLLEPNFLEQMIRSATAESDVVTCSADWKDEEHGNTQILRSYDQQALEEDALSTTITNPIGTVSTLLRRDKVLDIDGFDETVCCWEDGDLFVRLAAAGARFRVVNEVLAYSMRHGAGASANQQYCAQCRQEFLFQYAGDYPQLSRKVLTDEFEKVAIQFFTLNEHSSVKTLLEQCRSIGIFLPQTSNPLLSLLSPLLPSHFIFLLQQYTRRL